MEPHYERGDVRLWNCDCLEWLTTLEAGSVDAVVTDPPYGVNFQGKNTKHTARAGQGYASGIDDGSIGPAVIRICVERFGRVLATVPAQHAFDYPKPVEIGGIFCPSGAGLGKWGFIGTHPVLYYGKCPYLASGGGHRPNSIRSFAVAKDNGHPCPKPLEWMLWLVSKASLSGQSIADPFMGSGTTGVACIQTGRRFLGCEIDKRYFDIACKRIDDTFDTLALIDPTPPAVRQGVMFADKEQSKEG